MTAVSLAMCVHCIGKQVPHPISSSTSQSMYVIKRWGTSEPGIAGSRLHTCVCTCVFCCMHTHAHTHRQTHAMQQDAKPDCAIPTRLSAPRMVLHFGKANTEPGQGTASNACWACKQARCLSKYKMHVPNCGLMVITALQQHGL